MRAFLDGDESLSRNEAVSHRDCLLGQWYYAEGMKNYGHIAEMQAIEQPHSELHRLIHEIIESKEKGRMDEAEALLAKIAPLSQQIIVLLDSVEREIGAG